LFTEHCETIYTIRPKALETVHNHTIVQFGWDRSIGFKGHESHPVQFRFDIIGLSGNDLLNVFADDDDMVVCSFHRINNMHPRLGRAHKARLDCAVLETQLNADNAIKISYYIMAFCGLDVSYHMFC
jgi:hypothetical protein